MNPTVTVVVLTFNSARYIARCLDSLVSQTCPDFEAVVVDAGSTDATHQIVGRYDARFRWVDLPGSDMGAARNAGARHGSGQYVTFLDSDDFYLPRKLELQLRALDADPALDGVGCDTVQFRTGRPERLGVRCRSDAAYSVRDYLRGQFYNVNTLFLRRSLWDEGIAFSEGPRGRYGEEWRLQLHMALRGVRMGLVPEPLVVVEMRADSHTSWSVQPRLKKLTIEEVQTCAATLPEAVREKLEIEAVLDEHRQKLFFAHLACAEVNLAREVYTALPRSVQWKLAAWSLLSHLLPASSLAAIVRRLWIWRQNRSYRWDAALDSEQRAAIAGLADVSTSVATSPVRPSR
jgi:hypothetical protein